MPVNDSTNTVYLQGVETAENDIRNQCLQKKPKELEKFGPDFCKG